MSFAITVAPLSCYPLLTPPHRLQSRLSVLALTQVRFIMIFFAIFDFLFVMQALSASVKATVLFQWMSSNFITDAGTNWNGS